MHSLTYVASLFYIPSPQFECCGVNSTFDWLEYHPDIFATDGNQPPHECLCNADEDDHCMSFNFTYIPPGVFVEQRAIFDAWDRVSEYLMKKVVLLSAGAILNEAHKFLCV